MKINIEHNGIIAEGQLHPKKINMKYESKTQDGKNVDTLNFILCDSSKSNHVLSKKDAEEVTELLLRDEDIDLNLIGKKISQKRTVILNENNEIVYNYKIIDTLYKDEEKRIKDHEYNLGNIHSDIPMKILSKNVDKKNVFEHYIIDKSYYITHTEGTGYTFFYDLAKELSNDKMYWVRAFDPDTKKPSPLVLNNGGKKYNASFIEGKQIGEKYLLMLHLVEREFKIPEQKKEEKVEIKEKKELKLKKKKEKEEKSQAIEDTKTPLMIQFEKETGKNAILKSGNASKGFLKWKEIEKLKTPLMKQYEKETGKNPIRGGKPTKIFEQWKEERG